ncbi:unnamed protein product, partial [Rotaria magnacalcarata]
MGIRAVRFKFRWEQQSPIEWSKYPSDDHL